MPRPVAALAALTLLLTACGRPADTPDPAEADPVVEVPDRPEALTGPAEALLGTWVVTEQAGAMPERIYTVTFTTDGRYLVRDETGIQVDHAFAPIDERTIVVRDAAGREVERFTFDVSGTILRLTAPGAERPTVLERREDLLEGRPELAPPQPVDPEPAPAGTPESR